MRPAKVAQGVAGGTCDALADATVVVETSHVAPAVALDPAAGLTEDVVAWMAPALGGVANAQHCSPDEARPPCVRKTRGNRGGRNPGLPQCLNKGNDGTFESRIPPPKGRTEIQDRVEAAASGLPCSIFSP